MKTLITIMSHREAWDTFQRHLPLWNAHGCDIIVYSPVDSICPPQGHLGILYGYKGHHSAEANRRFKRLISFLATTAYDAFWIHEYDSFCLTPSLPYFFFKGCGESNNWDCPIFAANCFWDNSKEFEGSLFTHPPLYLNKPAIQLLDIHLKRLPDDSSKGFWDRMCGLAIENADITPIDFQKCGLGFARNTVESHDLSAAYEAAAAGAVMFHGIKSQSALIAIQAGHDEAKKSGKLREGLEIPL